MPGHEFFLVEILDQDKFIGQMETDFLLDIRKNPNIKVIGMIDIDDDMMVAEVTEKLLTIPCVNISGKYEKQLGICYFGMTLFDDISIEPLEKILSELRDELAVHHPESILIKLTYGSGQNLIYKQDEIMFYVKTLLEYICWMKKRNYKIMHYGI